MLERLSPRQYCFSIRHSLLFNLTFFFSAFSQSLLLEVKGWKFVIQETPLRVFQGFKLRSCPIPGGVKFREGWGEKALG